MFPDYDFTKTIEFLLAFNSASASPSEEAASRDQKKSPAASKSNGTSRENTSDVQVDEAALKQAEMRRECLEEVPDVSSQPSQLVICLANRSGILVSRCVSFKTNVH